MIALVEDPAVRTLRAQSDPEWGGFGRAPKFPPASVLEFLLRRARLSGSEPQSPAADADAHVDVTGVRVLGPDGADDEGEEGEAAHEDAMRFVPMEPGWR